MCIHVSLYRGSLIKRYHQESHSQGVHMEHSSPASPRSSPGLVPKGMRFPKPGGIPHNCFVRASRRRWGFALPGNTARALLDASLRSRWVTARRSIASEAFPSRFSFLRLRLLQAFASCLVGTPPVKTRIPTDTISCCSVSVVWVNQDQQGTSQPEVGQSRTAAAGDALTREDS